MSNSAVEITNLLYRYADKMDSGDLKGAAALFRHAQIKVHGSKELLDAQGILQIWRRHIKIYPCATPRTQHLITNPIIEIDEGLGKATVRSYYTVLQATTGLALQPIATGRYHDEFERIEQQWRFSYRDYSRLEFTGDLSFHLQGFE